MKVRTRKKKFYHDKMYQEDCIHDLKITITESHIFSNSKHQEAHILGDLEKLNSQPWKENIKKVKSKTRVKMSMKALRNTVLLKKSSHDNHQLLVKIHLKIQFKRKKIIASWNLIHYKVKFIYNTSQMLNEKKESRKRAMSDLSIIKILNKVRFHYLCQKKLFLN